MRLFKIYIRKVEVFEDCIVVAAGSEQEAKHYLSNNDDWKQDENLFYDGEPTSPDREERYSESYSPLLIYEMSHIDELPDGYTPESVPWNTDKKCMDIDI